MAFDAYSAPAPVEHPALTKQRLRSRLCRLIDRLVTALDEIDGDPDFEDGGDDEPGLGWPSNDNINQEYWIALAPSDDDREEDGDDLEPSLCGVEVGGGRASDLEFTCDDEGAFDGDNDTSDFEPDHDAEGRQAPFLLDRSETAH